MAGSREPLSSEFAALLRDVRGAEAVGSRIRERNLRIGAAADATIAGALLDLAERGTPVAIRTTSGRVVRGPVVLVGSDVVAVGTTLVPLRAIAVVRLPGGRRHASDTSGERDVSGRVSFAAVVGDLAAFRCRIAVVVAGEPVAFAGRLRSAGADVLTLSLETGSLETGSPVLVALAQVSELTVLASG